jgi:HIRAN domain
MSAVAAPNIGSTAAPSSLMRPQRLIVSWQHPTDRGIHAVGELTFDGETYEFAYLRNAEAIVDFRPLLGFPELHERYRSTHLFPLFAQRVMDPRRQDYVRYVTRLGLDPANSTPWEQISRSGGSRQGDTLQLFPRPIIENGRVHCSFLVHGVRHIPSKSRNLDGHTVEVSKAEHEQALSGLVPGDPLLLAREPENEANPRAIVITDNNGTPLGYVPDLLVEDVQRVMVLGRFTVEAVHVNSHEAPAHLRIVAQLDAELDPEFRFFDGPQWFPLS